MLVLGIETSGLAGSVALVSDGKRLAERRLNEVGRRHAQSLVLEIRELLRCHELTSRDIQTVAVSRGPGSFTGLRVGMVCAKTFAYATGCRFVAVDTFAAIAENLTTHVERVLVIDDAQRDDLFLGEYLRDESHCWMPVSPIRIISRAEFLRDRSDSDIVTGPGIRKLDPADISLNWLSDADLCSPRASTIAVLAQRQLNSVRNGLSSSDTDFWQASPFYLRLSAAEEKRASLPPNP